MVTDGILGAVQMIIDRFKTSDEIYALQLKETKDLYRKGE